MPARDLIAAFCQWGSDEANLSAVQDPACPAARIPCAKPDPRWSCRTARAAGAGTQTSGNLIPPNRVPGPDRRARAGLGPARRIGGRSGFEVILRDGTRRKLAGFTFILLSRGSGPARLGILVSRKHSARANVRNSIKRRIREAFRAEHQALGPVDVLVRPPFGIVPTARMYRQLREAFVRLGQS